MSGPDTYARAMPIERRLALDGSADAYLRWTADFQNVFGTSKDLLMTLQTCRTGVMPKCFTGYVEQLHPTLVLAMAGSSPSVWSIPRFGTARPNTQITVNDYLQHLAINKLAESHAPTQALTALPRAAMRASQTFKVGDRVEALCQLDDRQDWTMGIVTYQTEDRTTVSFATDEGVTWTVENHISVIRHYRAPSAADSAADDQSTTSGKRSKRDRELGSSPEKQATLSIRRDRDLEKVNDFLASVPKAIAYFRASVHPSAQPRLTKCDKLSNAEENDDLLGAHCALMDLALFGPRKRDAFASDLRRKIEQAPAYRFDPTKVDFPSFSALYVSTLQILKYADPTTNDEFMVKAMIAQLPDVQPYSKIRRDLTTSRFVDQATEDAKGDLDALVILVTEELQTAASLKKDDPFDLPLVTNFPAATNEADFKAAVLRFAAQMNGSGGNAGGGGNNNGGGGQNGNRNRRTAIPLDETILEQCRKFQNNSCPYGDKCKYGHFTPSTADHRVKSGQLLASHRQAIEAEKARVRSEFKAKKPSALINFIKQLQAENASLKKN
jgi:hypothetical protein